MNQETKLNEEGQEAQNFRIKSDIESGTAEINISPEFKLYNTKEYLNKIYPDFDSEILKPVIDEILGKSEDTKIDVGELCSKFGIERVIAENLCLLAFNSRVAKHLLKEYPTGSASSIEIDGGGVFIGHGTSSFVAKNIKHFEYLESGKEASLKWLMDSENQAQEAHNWDNYLKFIQESLKNDTEIIELLNFRAQSEDEETRSQAEKLMIVLRGNIDMYKNWIRERIDKEIQRGDIFKDNFGQGEPANYDIAGANYRRNAYDFVTSNFTSESATDRKFSWLRGMKNVMNAVKPGGYLVLTACLDTDHYFVDGKEINATSVTSNEIIEVLTRKGRFEIVECKETSHDGKEEDNELGYKNLGFFLAKKMHD